jgi:hypothetical protein
MQIQRNVLNIPKRILELQVQMHLLPIWKNIIILN